jgi:hypothetical protein
MQYRVLLFVISKTTCKTQAILERVYTGFHLDEHYFMYLFINSMPHH